MFVALLRLDDIDDDVDMHTPRALLLGGARIDRPYRKKSRNDNEARGTAIE